MPVDPALYPYFDPKNDRRVAVVTGGNLGIGFYTVLHLYLHGFVVYIAGRSRLRVNKAITEIHQQATERTVRYSPQQTETRPTGELVFLELDLLDLELVARAAENLARWEQKLHILVNNAGVMALPFSITQDGFEIQQQTNHVAPFLFTMRLLPLLEAAASLLQNPRIINLLLVGHHFAFRYFSMDLTFNYHPNIIFTWFRYGLAKTASIHLMKMLALRNPHILCLSVHPGFVMNTNLFAYWTRLPFVGILFWCFFQLFGWVFGVSNEEGATALLKCCLDPQLSVENDNGKYYATEGVETQPLRVARNMDYAARTWIWTVKQLGDRGFSIG